MAATTTLKSAHLMTKAECLAELAGTDLPVDGKSLSILRTQVRAHRAGQSRVAVLVDEPAAPDEVAASSGLADMLAVRPEPGEPVDVDALSPVERLAMAKSEKAALNAWFLASGGKAPRPATPALDWFAVNNHRPVARKRHAADRAPVAPSATTPKGYAAPGALRAMVAAYLTEHGDAEWTASGIGKALTKSGGAIQLCLEKLVKEGAAVQTCEKPRRYQAVAAG
jgi:hypothetical protein